MLRKKLTKNVGASAPGDTDGGVCEHQTRSAISRGIVEVREGPGTHVAEQVGIVGHRMSAIASSHEGGADGMPQSRLERSGSLIEIPGIFVKD